MKKSVLLVFSLLVCKFLFAQNVFPTSGNVGIGTTSPSKKLDIVGNGINLENTNHANQGGIIFKNGSRFISNFNYGNNGTITTTGHNIFIGLNAGNFSMGSTATSPFQSSYNIGIGYKVLYNNTTGYHSTAIGYEALYQNTSGYNNTALGYAALLSNTAGSHNTAVGYESNKGNKTGNNSVFIGAYTKALTTSDNNEIVIGYNTTGAGSNSVVLGNSSITKTLLQGNVGIGTFNPDVKLTVSGGNIKLSNPMGYPSGINIDFNFGGGWAREYSFSYSGTGKLFSLGAYGSGASLIYGYLGGNTTTNAAYNSPWMVFLPSGNVGIGTKNPVSKLSVNGGITAQKVKVTQSGWPDYVFDSTYDLKPLKNLKEYIYKYGHLPKIPSAKEMIREGNDLGQTDALLLQKIEELTLYLLEQDQQLKNQKKKIIFLEKENNFLINEIEAIKIKLK